MSQKADQKANLIVFGSKPWFMILFCRTNLWFGLKDELKNKLMHENPLVVSIETPPARIQLCDENLIELALFQLFNVTTTLSKSKHSPMFINHKSKNNLKVLFNPRRVNHFWRHDFHYCDFLISIMTEATVYFYRQNLFRQRNCSQA